jgi:hypothetical protein
MATSIDARTTLNMDIHQWNKDSTSIAPQTTSEGTPNDDPRVLWCLIEGDGFVPVSLAAKQRIIILKECIHAKGKTTVDAKDLELLKVSDMLGFFAWFASRARDFIFLESSTNLCSFS